METNVKINIDDYLSEEEKKEIAVDVFRTQVKNELFNSTDGTVQSDAEVQRVIGNITAAIVFKEVQKYIPDAKEKIKKKTEQALNKDISYYVFRKKDAWEKEESLAITYINESVKDNRDHLKARVKKTLESFDLMDSLREEVATLFDNMGSNFYSLSELFIKKQED